MTREHLAHLARLRWESPILAGWKLDNCRPAGSVLTPDGSRTLRHPVSRSGSNVARLGAFWRSTVAPVAAAAGFVLLLWLAAIALGLAAGGW